MTKPYATIGLLTLTTIFGVALSSSYVSADDVIDDVLINISVSCTMTGTGQNSHNAEVPNGTYRDEIGITTLKVACNDTEGFAIYAIGFTGEQYTGEDHTKLIGVNSNQKISTGTATSGSTSNWAMKLATDSTQTYPITLDNSFDNYHIVPDTYTKVAHRDSGTDVGTTATGATLTTTYASFISAGQAADTYSGKVKYTLVHPANETPLQPQTTASGKICYYANASDAVGTMGCQTIPTSGGSADTVSPTAATLLASNFSRTGYGFAGWSDAFDYATNSNAHFYGPQETITYINGQYVGEGKGLSLYAVWVKSEGSLQDSSKVATLCGTGAGSLTTTPTDGTANLASVSALTDQRDNQTYAIAKLADGNCWMIENLRLESTNSDNSTGALAQGYGTSATYGNFSGLADAESSNFENSTVANSLYFSGTQSGDATINIGTTNYPDRRMPRYNNTNTSARASSPTVNTAAMYSYGNYYTWSAAMANTIHYNSPTAQDADGKTSETVNTSLCPTGWKLPRGGDKPREATNDLWTLIVTGVNGGIAPANYDSSTYPYYTGTTEATPIADKLRSFPNNFLYSGFFSMSSTYSRSSYGYYWSSTAYNNYNSYNLNLFSSYVYPGTSISNKDIGYSIRCTIGS